MTKSRISSPTVTSMRPMAAIVRRTTLDGTGADQPFRPLRASVSPPALCASYTLAVSLPVPGAALLRVVHLRSAVCMLGRFPTLAGADLEVDAGEIVLLAGANGAGKTTLLRLCAGLLPLRSGSAEVLGVDLAVDRRSIRRSLALVGHETFCYDDLTVHENIRFATRAAGRSAADADAALERLALGRAARVTHSRLSQGQRRRVALAIALARDPRLLLLDEPHAGLDEQGRSVLDDGRARRARRRAAPCCSRRTSSTSPARSRRARSGSPPARCTMRRRAAPRSGLAAPAGGGLRV